MAWRENEAFQRFIQAALTFKDLHGSDKFVDLLEQELHRELVVRKYAETSRALIVATSAAEQSSQQLDTAVKALEFYAEGDNHKARNAQASAVARDRGRKARRALEAISGEGETDDSDKEEAE